MLLAKPSSLLGYFLAAGLLIITANGPGVRGEEPFDPAAIEFFEKQVRPVLAARCYECHSGKLAKPKGGLRLDSRAAVLKGGETGPAIVPGNPKESLLVDAIHHGAVYQMPPKTKLPAAEIAALTKWVELGAPWPAGREEAKPTNTPAAGEGKFDLAARKAAHWCWQPVKAAPPPEVKNNTWCADPLDRFILAKLEEQNLAPAEAADRRALIRRASLALTGFPPTPAEVQSFLADTSPQAYEKVVYRLLASPHFGERWARHWLDLVRYAESRGHEYDYDIPTAWHYRDYVIRAFNADVPYNQFVTEHIAGDLLKEPRTSDNGRVNESIIGTGFWHLGEWVHSPVDIRQDELDRVDNQLDVFGKTFLGLTVACARCHDHKFDAISQRDYYALSGYLSSSSYQDAAFEWGEYNHRTQFELMSLDRTTKYQIVAEILAGIEPVTSRFSDYLLAAREVLFIQAVDEKDRALPSKAQADLIATLATERKLLPEAVAVLADELARAERDPFSYFHFLTVRSREKFAESVAAWKNRYEELESRKQSNFEILAGNHWSRNQLIDWIVAGDAFCSKPLLSADLEIGLTAEIPILSMNRVLGPRVILTDSERPGLVRTAEFIIKQPQLSYRVQGSGNAFVCVQSHRMVEGPLHGGTRKEIKSDEQWRWVTHNVQDYLGCRAHVEFTQAKNKPFALSSVVQSDRKPLEPLPSVLFHPLKEHETAARPAALAHHAYSLLQSQMTASARIGPAIENYEPLLEWVLVNARKLGYGGEQRAKVAKLLADYRVLRNKLVAEFKPSATCMAMLDGPGFNERLLIRGNHRTPGETVQRRFLEVFDSQNPLRIHVGKDRLELAQHVTATYNPLTARVMVNRVWHHLLGRGIVGSVDNFGVLGEKPTHPELLDHLADRFVRDGWSVKKLIRAIMLSSTYCMGGDGASPDESGTLTTSATATKLDPTNRLYRFFPPRRLEGEVLRDAMLSVSGRLDAKQFGPSVPVHLTPFMEGRGRPAKSGPVDGDGRRSIYLAVRRNFLSPWMLAFDTPAPFNSMGRRATSNVPTQALALMNDPLVAELAKEWSKKVLASPAASNAARIELMYETAFSRPPDSAELHAAEAFLSSQAALHDANLPPRVREERAWADLAHVLFNSKEFLFAR